MGFFNRERKSNLYLQYKGYNTLMQLQNLQDVFSKVLSKRILIYSSTHQDSFNAISTLRECEKLINNEHPSLRCLLYYLIINITKAMELESLNSDGIQRFNQNHFHSIKHKTAFGFEPFLNRKLIIKPLTNVLIIDKVKQKLKNNKKIIEIIVMEQIEFCMIDQYFKEIQIYTYSDKPLAKCVSSYDGQFLFIKEDDTLLENLEFAAVNNIYFWLIQNKNPFLILTELNSSIMLEHLPIEACDFYSYHVYNRRFNFNPHNIVGIQYY